jgi:hypothetical protein
VDSYEQMMAEVRRKELIRESEQKRINAENIRMAKSMNGKNHPLYGPALAKTGDALVAIGRQLQGRYSDITDLPTKAATATTTSEHRIVNADA